MSKLSPERWMVLIAVLTIAVLLTVMWKVARATPEPGQDAWVEGHGFATVEESPEPEPDEWPPRMTLPKDVTGHEFESQTIYLEGCDKVRVMLVCDDWRDTE